VIIIAAGYFELIRLTIKTKKIKTGILGLAVFTVVFFSFYSFSFLKNPIFFTPYSSSLSLMLSVSLRVITLEKEN
jgi:presenilin-like A22 family membrane protease